MYHFAMFSDIISSTSEETLEKVEAFCEKTGADWAATFYTVEGWQAFEDWKAGKVMEK